MKDYDLVIIGGGTVGTACFLDGVSRGLKVALIEKGEIGMQTNASSLGLIQGGAKYLGSDSDLVMMGSIDVGLMTRIAGEFLTKIKMVIPTFRGSGFPLWFWDGYLDAYDRFAHLRNCGKHKIITASQLASLEPDLSMNRNNRYFANGAVMFEEWLANPVELSWAMADYAQGMGGSIFENSVLRKFYCRENHNRRIGGLTIKSRDEETDITGSYFINAAGPWAPRILDLLGAPRFKTRLTRGTSIIVDRELVRNAVIVFDEGGKYITVMPYGPGRTLIGPTNCDISREVADNPDLLVYQKREQDELLLIVNRNFKTSVSSENIVGVNCGLRPQLNHRGVKPDEISHQFIIIDHEERDGIVNCCTVFGGKLSVQLRMAKEAVDFACSKLNRSGLYVSRSWNIPKFVLSRSGRLRMNMNQDPNIYRYYDRKYALGFRSRVGGAAMIKKIKARLILAWFIGKSFVRSILEERDA